MLPLFVNRSNNAIHDDDLSQEITRFFTLYLFAKRTCFYCWISHYFPIWNDRKIWSDRMVMALSNLFNKATRKQTFEEMISIADYARKIRSHKHKSKEDIKFLHQYNHTFEVNRKTNIENLEIFFRQTGIWEWLGLLDETTALPIGFHTPENIKDNQEDPLIEILINEITQDDGLLMLNYDASIYYKEISIVKSMENFVDCEKPCFYSMPLFSFPFCNNLAKEKMQALRAGIQAKMIIIAAMTDKFIKAIRKEEFNAATGQKCSMFYNELQPELQLMQNHIDNEAYFQQRKHSADKYTLLTLNLCMAPVAIIIDYYETSKTLLPYAASALSRQLSLMTDINKGMAFLNLTSSEIKTF